MLRSHCFLQVCTLKTIADMDASCCISCDRHVPLNDDVDDYDGSHSNNKDRGMEEVWLL